jgi:hypothetical protein
MSIDLQNETLLTFSEASARVPGRVSVQTLHRWRLRGVRGVKLESCKVGGKRITSAEALQRFSDRLSGDDVPQSSAGHSRLRRQERLDAKMNLDKQWGK